MTKQIDFSKFSSIKVGPVIDVTVVDECLKIPKEAYIIGSCSNILIGENPPPLYMLSKTYDYIKLKDGLLRIGAATPSGKIASFCKKNNIGGFEFLSHLPGKLGGLVKMNAGLKEYEIFNNLLFIRTCKRKILKKEIDFGYRYTKIDDIILEATFHYSEGFDTKKVAMFQKMRKNQPSQPSAGSCFKNPKGDFAGRLIEAAGLKGKRNGNMGWSELHANFLVNYGGGTYMQAYSLIQEAEEKIQKLFGITLEREIILLDSTLSKGTL